MHWLVEQWMDVFVLDCGVIYFLFPSPFSIFNPDCVIVETNFADTVQQGTKNALMCSCLLFDY